MMKKLLIFAIIMITHNCFAKQLESYQEIRDAVSNGSKILVVTDFSKCDTPRPILGQLTPTEIMVTTDSIIFSVNHFTTNNPKHKDQAVNEYITYTLKQDNKLAINIKIISLPKYQISHFSSNTCSLNHGATFFTY